MKKLLILSILALTGLLTGCAGGTRGGGISLTINFPDTQTAIHKEPHVLVNQNNGSSWEATLAKADKMRKEGYLR